MNELTSDIKLYLTSLEPNLAQSIYSQSIGGYPSTTLVYPETTLNKTIGLYEMILELSAPASGWTSWAEVDKLSIGSEIIKVEEVVNNNVTITQRGVNNILNMHLLGDEVRGISPIGLFNNVLNDNYKQYRCIAVKNTGQNVLSNTYLYIKQNSINPNTEIKVAIEIPKSQFVSSISTSWNSTKLVDTSLVGRYEDNQFKEAYLKVLSGPNSGQNRIINSYDDDTGMFIFYNSLPVEYDSSVYSPLVTYEIEPAPSQRIKSGKESPMTGTDYVTIFSQPNQYYPTTINISDVVKNAELYPDDVFYIWVERTLTKGVPLYEDNSVILTVNVYVPGS